MQTAPQPQKTVRELYLRVGSGEGDVLCEWKENKDGNRHTKPDAPNESRFRLVGRGNQLQGDSTNEVQEFRIHTAIMRTPPQLRWRLL